MNGRLNTPAGIKEVAPRQQLGRAAAGMLIEESADDTHQHQQVIFQPQLIVHQSTSF